MKKIFTILGALALMFTSCTADKPTDSGSYNGPKADVVATMSTVDGGSSATAKNVQRPAGTYAWVSSIAVTAKPTNPTWNYSVSENYNLLGTGDSGYSTADSNFIIKDVAVGMNQFNATTTCNSTPVYQLAMSTGPGLAAALQTQMGVIKSHSPYAVYAGTTNANILNATANAVNFNMTTQNGRIMSGFILADDAALKANTYATVTVSVPGKLILTSDPIKNNYATFEWSDMDAIAGKTVTYTIKVYDDTAPNIVLKTYTITRAIAASTSYSCMYTIDRDQILNTQQDTMTFAFQVWNEVDCATFYDDDGYNCHGYDKNGHYDKNHDKDGKVDGPDNNQGGGNG